MGGRANPGWRRGAIDTSFPTSSDWRIDSSAETPTAEKTGPLKLTTPACDNPLLRPSFRPFRTPAIHSRMM